MGIVTLTPLFGINDLTELKLGRTSRSVSKSEMVNEKAHSFISCYLK